MGGSDSGEEEDETKQTEIAQSLANADVVTKYKAAAEIANRACDRRPLCFLAPTSYPSARGRAPRRQPAAGLCTL